MSYCCCLLLIDLAFCAPRSSPLLFLFNATATTELYTLSLHDALPISSSTRPAGRGNRVCPSRWRSPRRSGLRHGGRHRSRSEEHTSELQSLRHLVCRLLLEKKKNKRNSHETYYDDMSIAVKSNTKVRH